MVLFLRCWGWVVSLCCTIEVSIGGRVFPGKVERAGAGLLFHAVPLASPITQHMPVGYQRSLLIDSPRQHPDPYRLLSREPKNRSNKTMNLQTIC